jgi:hypothetical protein
VRTRIDADGAAHSLDRRREPERTFTPEDAVDATKLAREVQRLRESVAHLAARWAPQVRVFRGVSLPSSGTVRLRHGIRGPVEWFVGSAQDAAPVLTTSSDSDEDTLVLTSGAQCTASIVVVG